MFAIQKNCMVFTNRRSVAMTYVASIFMDDDDDVELLQIVINVLSDDKFEILLFWTSSLPMISSHLTSPWLVSGWRSFLIFFIFPTIKD